MLSRQFRIDFFKIIFKNMIIMVTQIIKLMIKIKIKIKWIKTLKKYQEFLIKQRKKYKS